MKIIKWTIAIALIWAICGSCWATLTSDTYVPPRWGLAGDEQSAEDIPIRDSGSNITATNVEDVIVGILDGTETFQSLTVTGTLTAGSVATSDTEIVASALTVTGVSILNGGLVMDTNKFTVDDGSGNTLIAGTLDVTGATTITGALTAASISGATAFAGKITANDGVTLGDDDDLIGSPTSDITLNTNKFTVAGATGDVAVNINKFTIAGASGNTLIAGTLAVTGAQTFTGATACDGGITVDSTAFIVADTSGNVSTAGTLTVTGQSTFNDHVNLGADDDLVGSSTSDINMDKFDVAGSSGDLKVNTTMFTVAGATGNTVVAGTFTVTGQSTFNDHVNLGTNDDLVGSVSSDINMNAFDVDGVTGNTVIGGTLGVTGTTIFTGMITANGGITLGAGDDLVGEASSNILINTNKFTVNGFDGNTLIAGTLTQTGVATFAATAVFNGGQTRKQTLTGNAVTIDGSAGPTLGVIGTTAQSQINAWQFDANPGGTDDWVYLRWRVPDGYITDSGRLNFTYSYSTAETDGDDVAFDFTLLVLTPGDGAAGGTVWDAAGTAGSVLDVDLVNGDGDQGKLMEAQINFEIETIAVGDEIIIGFFVDESACDLDASGTVDIHTFEIEWESTE